MLSEAALWLCLQMQVGEWSSWLSCSCTCSWRGERRMQYCHSPREQKVSSHPESSCSCPFYPDLPCRKVFSGRAVILSLMYLACSHAFSLSHSAKLSEYPFWDILKKNMISWGCKDKACRTSLHSNSQQHTGDSVDLHHITWHNWHLGCKLPRPKTLSLTCVIN